MPGLESNYSGRKALLLLGVCLLIALGSWPLWLRFDRYVRRWMELGTREIIAEVVVTFLVCFVVLAPIYGWVLRRRLQRLISKRWRLRRERVQRLLAATGAASRFLHRAVELAALDALLARGWIFPKTALPRAALEQAVATLPAGETVCGPLRYFKDLPPVAIPWPFEPVDAEDAKDVGRLVDWLSDCAKVQQRDILTEPWWIKEQLAWRSGKNSHPNTVRTGYEPTADVVTELKSTAMALVFCAFTALFVFAIRWRRPWLMLVLPAAFVVVFAWAMSLYRRHFLQTRIWLVPGGVVVATHRLGRARGQALYASRARTPLVADLLNGRGFVRAGGEARGIPFRWPHLIAWMASAPSPSIEAVQALVGEDVELTVAE
jgi:hypothetical protein